MKTEFDRIVDELGQVFDECKKQNAKDGKILHVFGRTDAGMEALK